MSRRDHQPNSKILERIALFGVVLFGLGITYAIHVTNKTVDAMEKRGVQFQAQIQGGQQAPAATTEESR